MTVRCSLERCNKIIIKETAFKEEIIVDNDNEEEIKQGMNAKLVELFYCFEDHRNEDFSITDEEDFGEDDIY